MEVKGLGGEYLLAICIVEVIGFLLQSDNLFELVLELWRDTSG